MKNPVDIQREMLPIPDTIPAGVATRDAKEPDNKYPPLEPRGAPKMATPIPASITTPDIERKQK